MQSIPRERTLDSSLALLSEGYRFVTNRCRQMESDVFRTRLMLSEVYCAQGEEAARVFYHPGRFTRRGALPPTVLTLLQDRGSVATLDGQAHRHRKAMFMGMMTPEGLQRMGDAFERAWRARYEDWRRAGEVVLHEQVEEVLCRAICEWAGVPLPDEAVPQRARELSSMIEGAGSVGGRNLRGQLLRARTERWMRGLVEDVRGGRSPAPGGSPLRVIASHRDETGALLDTKIAAVEVINLLRPTVAVARYVTFSALALHEHPERRQWVLEGEPERLRWLTQEVRRFYPFFPVVSGIALEPFEWRDHHFDRGTWMMLDLYGTNHDPRLWTAPERFDPERFSEWTGSPFSFIPQGGGEFIDNHRCAGEWMTIDLVGRAVRLLTEELRYEVPRQDLSIDLSRMPAIPASRFRIHNVQVV